jgi:predicted nuclease with RNAse H fold
METPIYLGIDIAGADNTWACSLVSSESGVAIERAPTAASLTEIISYCQSANVVAVAIDAQLSLAPSDERGFRSSDLELRQLLPAACRNWVASFNSLMAVPVRGYLIAEALSPIVGTILETHPRASLWAETGVTCFDDVRGYKTAVTGAACVAKLWDWWCTRFQICATAVPQPKIDGALDALVCATTAYLFHHALDRLLRLRHDAPDKHGRGPFYVLSPVHMQRNS